MNNPIKSIGELLDKVVHGDQLSYTGPHVPVDQILNALAYNETRGVKTDPYSFYQSSGNKTLGNAMGKYQVTQGELASYAPRFLGQPTTSEQFQQSAALQDKYMRNKIQYYGGMGYTPQQIADIHRSGFTKAAAPGSTTYQNPAYVDSFNQAFQPRTVQALNQ